MDRHKELIYYMNLFYFLFLQLREKENINQSGTEYGNATLLHPSVSTSEILRQTAGRKKQSQTLHSSWRPKKCTVGELSGRGNELIHRCNIPCPACCISAWEEEMLLCRPWMSAEGREPAVLCLLSCSGCSWDIWIWPVSCQLNPMI